MTRAADLRGEPVPGDVLEQAIDWLVRLDSGMAAEADRAACEAWRSRSPLHERAWQQLQAVEEDFRAVPAPSGHVAYRALAASGGRGTVAARRRALKALAFGGAGLAGFFVARQLPWDRYMADHATARGERFGQVLADGTRLFLNTDTAVDVRFTADERLLLLRRGEILIQTGPDTASPRHRPLRVVTSHARFEALGTRFVVRERERVSHLAVTQGAVAVHPAFRSGERLVVAAGEAARVSAAGIERVAADARTHDEAAWVDGALVVRGMRLDDLVVEVARYHSGWLHCDPAVAGLRVSGVFQLDRPAQILEALRRSLPVRVEQRFGYWITLRPAVDTAS